jgi:hypothetical protein
MIMNKEQAIAEYQCPGCSAGSGPECATPCNIGIGCGSHVADTFLSHAGRLYLGMPKGFNRIGGSDKKTPLHIFESYETFYKEWAHSTVKGEQNGYDEWNVPVWKFLDEHGSTLVRGLSPRVNGPFLHVFLEDCRDKINCLEITKEMQNGMD